MNRQSEYWAKNVLSWEKGAYYRNEEVRGKFRILDRLSRYFRGDSIYKRSDAAFELVKDHVANQVVCDVGCASGRFARRLLNSGAQYVYGIDVSQDAVDLATQLAQKDNYDSKSEFHVLDVTKPDTPLPESYLTISLGVIEYFDQSALNMFLANLRSQYYCFSFIIRPKSNNIRLRKLLRSVYLYFQACPGIFYYSVEEFQNYCNNAGIAGEAQLIHTAGGSFITNLPISAKKS
jgi:SAM-dependent methyltransferase